MADIVEYYMQDMVPELDDLRRKNIFSDEEIRHIVRKRRDFEYSLQRTNGKPQDYLNYVRYEIAMESLRRRRSKALRWRKRSLSDNAGIRRIHRILERATGRFKGDLKLWYQHVDFCLRSGSSEILQRVLMKALKLHPKEASLWLLAADRELRQGHVDAARKLLMRGLRCLPKSVKLLSEFLRLEVGVAGQLLIARELAEETEVKEETKDVWAPTKLLFQKGLGKLEGKAVSTAKFLVEASALHEAATAKWAASEGFQAWSQAILEAAAQRRPGLKAEDVIMSQEVSDEAAVSIWEVWWKQELAAGNSWSAVAGSIVSCEIPAVLLKAMQAALEADAQDVLAALANAEASAADPDTALAILQELESRAGRANVVKGAWESLLNRAVTTHPHHLRLAMLTGDEAKVCSLLPHLNKISAEDAASFVSLKNSKEGSTSMKELEQVLRALEPGQSVNPVLLTVLEGAAKDGQEALRRCLRQVRKLAKNLWDAPPLRLALLSALLDAELRAELEAKEISKHFEDLLFTIGPSSTDAMDVWLRYLQFAQDASGAGVPSPNDLHLRALREVKDQDLYREKAQMVLQGHTLGANH